MKQRAEGGICVFQQDPAEIIAQRRLKRAELLKF